MDKTLNKKENKMKIDGGFDLLEFLIIIAVIIVISTISVSVYSHYNSLQNNINQTPQEIGQQIYYNCVKTADDDSKDAREIIDSIFTPTNQNEHNI